MKKPPLEFYKDVGGKWRWRTHARNGKVTADSSEGYARRAGAERGAAATITAIANAKGLLLVSATPRAPKRRKTAKR
jgi:uncharacterized protein YegP (UPF0339 family)